LLPVSCRADKLPNRLFKYFAIYSLTDIPQMQCIRAFVAQQPDELSLEKADVLLVHQQSSDGWVEGTRLSDRQRGWAPESHLEIIHSEKARQCNLVDALKITAATATV
uniref:SH3 domain-containing protein n=1 Tax=Astyanax mexicanus TaxID=7994 RepID=A0A8B9KV13_ASTMX